MVKSTPQHKPTSTMEAILIAQTRRPHLDESEFSTQIRASKLVMVEKNIQRKPAKNQPINAFDPRV